MNEREEYVTDMVATWLANEGEFITVEGEEVRIAEHAAALAEENRLDSLKRFVESIIRTAPTHGPLAAAGEVRRELAHNDYARINWAEVSAELRATSH